MFNNLRELVTSMPTEQDCRDYFAKQRWPDGKAYCPHCGSGKVYAIAQGKRYECGEKLCLKRFSVTCGTIFHGSNIGLAKWFLAVYLCINHKKGISSHQLGRDIGVTQKTAWHMLHRIRKINESMGNQLFTESQMDEWHCGGIEENKHKDKKGKKIKAPVLGMLDKQHGVRLKVLPKLSKDLVLVEVEKHIKPESIVITDALYLYKSLGSTHKHIIINHTAGEFKNAQGYHNNGIENVWSQLSRTIFGIHHWVSDKHLQRYCDSTAWKFNTRKMKDADRFVLALQQTEGTLPYKVLTAKK